LVVDKYKHIKTTDHVAEQIEMKFKAATVPQFSCLLLQDCLGAARPR
jgi:hypothetical protein